MGYRKHKHLGPFSAEKPKQSQFPLLLSLELAMQTVALHALFTVENFLPGLRSFGSFNYIFLKSPSKIKQYTYGTSSGVRCLSEIGYFCLCLTA